MHPDMVVTETQPVPVFIEFTVWGGEQITIKKPHKREMYRRLGVIKKGCRGVLQDSESWRRMLGREGRQEVMIELRAVRMSWSKLGEFVARERKGLGRDPWVTHPGSHNL